MDKPVGGVLQQGSGALSCRVVGTSHSRSQPPVPGIPAWGTGRSEACGNHVFLHPCAGRLEPIQPMALQRMAAPPATAGSGFRPKPLPPEAPPERGPAVACKHWLRVPADSRPRTPPSAWRRDGDRPQPWAQPAKQPHWAAGNTWWQKRSNSSRAVFRRELTRSHTEESSRRRAQRWRGAIGEHILDHLAVKTFLSRVHGGP